MRVLTVLLLLGCGVAAADTFLIKSTDGGRTWVDIDPGPPYQLLASFNVDPRTGILYAVAQRDGRSEGHLLVSTDGGQTWQARQSFPAAATWNILVAGGAVSPDTLYLANEDPSAGFVYPRSAIITRVTNGGRTVEQYRAEGLTIEQGTVPNSLGGYLTRLAVDAAAPSRLYAVVTNDLNLDIDAYFQALWVSTDGGRNWRRLEPPVTPDCTYPQISIDPSDSAVYLACGRSEFLKSTDGGESWMRKSTPDGVRIWNLQIGPGSPDTLYTTVSKQRGMLPCATSSLWRSTDGAATWQRAGDLPVYVATLRVHPSNPSVLVGTCSAPVDHPGENGIWRTENGGETWTKLAELGADSVLLIDAHAPDTLYAYSRLRQELRLNDRQTFLRNLLGEKQVAPGSLVSIYGRDLANETRVAEPAPLPVNLAGASVSFNGQPAPLLFVSPGQINAQVPFGLARANWEAAPPTSSVMMEVRRADGTVNRQAVSLLPEAVVVLRENATRQSPPLLFHEGDFRRVSADDPARRGQVISLLAVGMGELVPSLSAGELPSTPLPQLANPPCVVFSNPATDRDVAAMNSLRAGAAPGLIGVYRVDFDIPGSLSPGRYTLSLRERRVVEGVGRDCRMWYEGNRRLDAFTLDVN
jgi:uncharacterized protein (TIGR03437 family)